MNGSLWASSVLTGVTTYLVLVLFARFNHQRKQWPKAYGNMPGLVRLVWWPSCVLAPVIRRWVRSTWLERHQRLLARVDWDLSFDASVWIASRATYALGCGALAALALSQSSMRALLIGVLLGFGLGFAWGGAKLAHHRMQREQRIGRELPAYLDLLTVSVESGSTLTSGVRQIIETAPPSPLRDYFDRVLREIRGGRSRAQAFVAVAELYGVPSLEALATALSHGEASGMSLGAIFRAQSQQRTAERFARAEKMAMQAPVKLLGPLILCIFPCTFIVLAVPIVARLKDMFAL